MAKVVPGLSELDSLAAPLNEGERQVLECLRALDDDWLVFVQPSLGLDRPDFVAAHPVFGICVVEVKDWAPGAYRQTCDGTIEVRQQGEWKRSAQAPRSQAHRYRGAVHSHLQELSDQAPKLSDIRGVVVLPRYTTEQAIELFASGRRCIGEEYISVWGFDDLRDPTMVVTGVRQPRERRIRPEAFEALRRCLSEPEVLVDARLPLSLSEAAQNIEANPSTARIRRVRGAAGCGKSLGLAARAARLSLEGKDVLVVSFNSTLPNYLRELTARRCRDIGASLSHVTFTHIHELFSSAIAEARAAGHHLPWTRLEGTADPMSEQLDQAIQAYLFGYGQRFDAVLVDEGQDFTLEWWNFLRHQVCRPDGEMLLVADPAQDVYGKKAWTDEERMLGAGFSGPWAELDGSYRLPPDLTPVVAEFARVHLAVDVGPRVPADHPQRLFEYEPTSKRWVNTTWHDDIGRRVGEEVVRLLRDQPDLCPADIVFLVGRHCDGLTAAAVIERAGYPVQHIFGKTDDERRARKLRFWSTAPGVKGCTFHSFKGWEARAVVMAVGQRDAPQLAYVGLTRVKGDRANRRAFVTVVNGNTDLRNFGATFERAS